MKAFVFDSYAGPDACHFEDLPDPVPGPDDVLVRVHASSVNPWDYELSWGKPWINRMIAGGLARPKKIRALGCDLAGVVERVGANVTSFKPGDRVMADNSGSYWGGYAELALAKQAECALIPDDMSMSDAASLPQAGVLTWQGLALYGELGRAGLAMVNGAGGGMGPIAVQLLADAGVTVHGVDSADKLDAIRALGVSEVFDFRSHDFTRGPHRYDLILDPVQQWPGRRYRKVMTDAGLYVTVGGKYRHIAGVAASIPFQPLCGPKRLRVLVHKPNGRDLGDLAAACMAGRFRPVIAKVWDFADAAAALTANGRGEGVGKHVIRIA